MGFDRGGAHSAPLRGIKEERLHYVGSAAFVAFELTVIFLFSYRSCTSLELTVFFGSIWQSKGGVYSQMCGPGF